MSEAAGQPAGESVDSRVEVEMSTRSISSIGLRLLLVAVLACFAYGVWWLLVR